MFRAVNGHNYLLPTPKKLHVNQQITSLKTFVFIMPLFIFAPQAYAHKPHMYRGICTGFVKLLAFVQHASCTLCSGLNGSHC